MHGLSGNVCMSSRTCTHYFKLKPGSLNIPRSWFLWAPLVRSVRIVKFRHYLPGYCPYGYSSKAFIYSLTNNNSTGHAVYNPVKLRVKPDRYKYAVRRCDSFGPRFGWADIRISNNSASNHYSVTYCGWSSPLTPGYSLSGTNCTFYAGSYQFTPTDVEVFYEKTT